MAGCATGDVGYSPGAISKEQKARCREVAQAYVDRSEDYAELRDELRKDPVATSWFVRYLVTHIFVSRAPTADALPDQIVRINEARRGSMSPAEWRLKQAERPDVRAIREIVALGGQAVDVVINDLAVSPQQFRRTIGVELLAGIGEPAIPALLQLARSGDAERQRVAARALGQIGARGSALEALRELAHSPVWRIRSDAAQGLVHGDEDARDLLVEMLDDEDAFVRRKAGESLASYKEPVAANALVDFLEKCQESGDWTGELAAQKALRVMAGARGPRTVAAWRRFAQELVADGGGR